LDTEFKDLILFICVQSVQSVFHYIEKPAT
jgi:hypothetical protein